MKIEVRLWVLFLACSPAVGAKDPQPDDLSVVRVAQLANMSRYPHGQLRFTLRSGQIGNVTLHNRAECSVEWIQDAVRTEVRHWDKHGHEIGPGLDGGIVESWIVDAKKSIVYHPEAKRTMIVPVGGQQTPLSARMTPHRAWYAPLGLENVPWTYVLGAAGQGARGPIPSKIHYRTERKSADLIEVIRNDPETKGYARLLLSLRLDGNVTEYEIREPASGYTARGTCDWKRDAKDRVFLSSHRIDEIEDDGKIQKYMVYETAFFDPDHRPRPNRFTLEALNLAPGTMVTDEISRRRWRVGDAPSQSVVDQLGELIDAMKSRGFAARK